jgi:hypothetical protein
MCSSLQGCDCQDCGLLAGQSKVGKNLQRVLDFDFAICTGNASYASPLEAVFQRPSDYVCTKLLGIHALPAFVTLKDDLRFDAGSDGNSCAPA